MNIPAKEQAKQMMDMVYEESNPKPFDGSKAFNHTFTYLFSLSICDIHIERDEDVEYWQEVKDYIENDTYNT